MKEKKVSIIFHEVQDSLSNDSKLTTSILHASIPEEKTIIHWLGSQGLKYFVVLTLLFVTVSLICYSGSEICMRLAMNDRGVSIFIGGFSLPSTDDLSEYSLKQSNFSLNAFSLLGVAFRGVIPCTFWGLAIAWIYFMVILKTPEGCLFSRKENHA